MSEEDVIQPEQNLDTEKPTQDLTSAEGGSEADVKDMLNYDNSDKDTGKSVDKSGESGYNITDLVEMAKEAGVEVSDDIDDPRQLFQKGDSIPGEDASDEEKEAFYRKLGKPETPDNYSADIPEGYEIPDEIVGNFKEFAHEQNLSDAQFNGMLKFAAEKGLSLQPSQEQIDQQVAEQVEKEAESLKNIWGESFDIKKNSIKKLLEDFDPNGEFGGVFEKGKMKVLANVASQLYSEDTLHAASGGKTVSDVQKEMDDIQNSLAFKKKGHPEHEKSVQKWNELYDTKIKLQGN